MKTNTKIGIIGAGNVGGALSRGLALAGFQVSVVGHDRTELRQTADWADLVILAVPFGALDEVAKTIEPVVTDKPIIDVTKGSDAAVRR